MLVSACLLLCSKSCDQGERSQEYREAQAIQLARDSILDEFRTAPPLPENGPALDMAVKSGLNDLISYLNIISDRNKPSGFREQAAKMATALSENDNVLWSVSCHKESHNKRINISGQMHDSSGFTGFYPLRMPDSLYLQKPLRKENDSVFRGNLNFIYSDQSSQNQDSCYLTGKSVSFSVVRFPKYFGSDTLYIWTVKFSGNH
jgi:hypothetical protein